MTTIDEPTDFDDRAGKGITPLNMHTDAIGAEAGHQLTPLNMHTDLVVTSVGTKRILSGRSRGGGLLRVVIPAAVSDALKDVIPAGHATHATAHSETPAAAAGGQQMREYEIASATVAGNPATGIAVTGDSDHGLIGLSIDGPALAALRGQRDRL